MMLKRIAPMLVAGLILAAGMAALFAQSTPAVVSGPVGPSPYSMVRYWPKPFSETGFAFGGNSTIFAASPVGSRRDLQRHLRVLQRWRQTAPDARRKGRAGHGWHSLWQASGRGISSRRANPHRRRSG